MSQTNPDLLFDGYVPVSEVDEEEDASMFEPADASEIEDTDLGDGPALDEQYLEWLFLKDSRVKLVSYALEAVQDDPIYLNKSELGDLADTSRHSVHRHIDDLVDIGVYEQIGESAARYRPNPNSRVLKAIGLANEEIGEQRHF